MAVAPILFARAAIEQAGKSLQVADSLVAPWRYAAPRSVATGCESSWSRKADLGL